MPLEDMGNPNEQPSVPAANVSLTGLTGSSSPGEAAASDPASVSAPSGQPVTGFSLEQLGEHPYGVYMIDTRYTTDLGIIGCQVAAIGAPAKLIAVGGGISHKVVRWTVERLGEKPILPHWDTGNSNEVCKKHDEITASTILTPDGRKVWRFSGLYLYVLSMPVKEGHKYYCGAPPFDTSPASLQYIDGNTFSREILRAAE